MLESIEIDNITSAVKLRESFGINSNRYLLFLVEINTENQNWKPLQEGLIIYCKRFLESINVKYMSEDALSSWFYWYFLVCFCLKVFAFTELS